MTDSVAGLLVALFGLAVGSFLNVCIHRLPRGTSVVTPPSHCPACGEPIRWFDNLPVLGYLVLRGRCRACRAPICPLYPFVESVTAVLFLVQHQALGLQPLLAPRLLFTAAMIVLFAVDLRHQLLPNVVTLPGIVIGLFFSIFLEPGWGDALLGTIAGGGALLAIAVGYFLSAAGRGWAWGDVKMLAMIGAFLGWPLAFVTLAWGVAARRDRRRRHAAVRRARLAASAAVRIVLALAAVARVARRRAVPPLVLRHGREPAGPARRLPVSLPLRRWLRSAHAEIQ